jgi:anaerobic selenocysteine-containing dehydrogenase
MVSECGMSLRTELPQSTESTHITDILRHIEQGSIQFLWISGTNPAVTLPELRRMRKLLTTNELFLVVQDIFETETTQVGDSPEQLLPQGH